ncbi:IgGFc-binding protein-like isoform X2 [Amphiura filiformis]|uniref:IgGFc-binding protein-like isoform X2 n=1 Tax=Amphiura filiformis TaxID=82378 RepID=UPI003B21A459
MEKKMARVFQVLFVGYSLIAVTLLQDVTFNHIGGGLLRNVLEKDANPNYGGELVNMLDPLANQKSRSTNVFRNIPAEQGTALDTRGKEFMFSFISNFMRPHHLKLLIGATGPGSTSVNIQITRLNFNRDETIPAGRRIEVEIPVEAVAVGVGPQNGTIWVRSNQPITVHGVNQLINTNEAFLAIPVNGLGNEYFVASYTPVPIEQSEFLVTGTQDLTRLRIEPSVALKYNNRLYNPGDPLLLTINKLQSVQFQSVGDLTGTKIKADKHISVMSGATCTLVPSQTYRCDHLVENIPPVHTWGKQFTLLPFLNRTAGYVFRIIAARPATRLDVSGTPAALNKEGAFKEFDQIAPFPVTITSDKPVLVVQYAKGLETDSWGDPFMVVVPPVEQYISGSVTFGTFDNSGKDTISSYLSMSITSADLVNFNVNGRPASAAGSGGDLGRAMSFGFDRSMKLPPGSNTINNPQKGSTYSAIIYGFADGTGYAMPAGYGLKKLLCSEMSTATGVVREFDCPGTGSPVNQPGSGGNTGVHGHGGSMPDHGGYWTVPPQADQPQTDEKCYSLPILLLSIIAPAIVIFLIMLIIMCGLMYRRTK